MNARQLYDRLSFLSLPVDMAACGKLAHYHAMLLDYNTRMDLTAVTEEMEMLDRHYADSLMPLSLPELFPLGASLIDVGTGAGFPGLPLAIARPDLKVTLLDALQKRVGFLNDVIGALGLYNAQAVHMRAEDAARSPAYRERFDIAAARAVAALPTLLEYTLPFVRVGGQALLWKGPAALCEIPACRPVAHLLGGQLQEPIPMPIAGRDWQHLVLPVNKSSATVRLYPRRSGMPHKQPLQVKVK